MGTLALLGASTLVASPKVNENKKKNVLFILQNIIF